VHEIFGLLFVNVCVLVDVFFVVRHRLKKVCHLHGFAFHGFALVILQRENMLGGTLDSLYLALNFYF